jgi:hypothetical protein
MDVRDRQIDSLHSLLIKHFEVVKEQELAHFRSIEQLRKRHLAVQHDMEQQNQRDSNKVKFLVIIYFRIFSRL